jgi:hypothetical protein
MRNGWKASLTPLRPTTPDRSRAAGPPRLVRDIRMAAVKASSGSAGTLTTRPKARRLHHRQPQQMARKHVRSSCTNNSGCSSAAKCPRCPVRSNGSVAACTARPSFVGPGKSPSEKRCSRTALAPAHSRRTRRQSSPDTTVPMRRRSSVPDRAPSGVLLLSTVANDRCRPGQPRASS